MPFSCEGRLYRVPVLLLKNVIGSFGREKALLLFVVDMQVSLFIKKSSEVALWEVVMTDGDRTHAFILQD